MNRYSIYVVDDEKIIREGLSIALGADYQVTPFSDAESAIEALSIDPPDLVLLDISLPGMNGIQALEKIKAGHPNLLVIMITAYEDVQSVISAMKLGAYDYIIKPIQMDGLELTLENAFETIRLRKEVRWLQEKFIQENLPCFIGNSDKIQNMMEFLEKVAQSPDTPILILGETGTGKELIASAIHFRSPNFRGKLVTVNCAAIPRDLVESEIFGYEKGAFSGAKLSGKAGLIEAAAGGTLFLDEVGDLGLEAQAKLLRFIENGEFFRIGGTEEQIVHTRVVSATNKNLEQMIQEGLFRKDLYFRLGVIQLKIPSLNERRNDIRLLADYFLDHYCKKFNKKFSGLAAETHDILRQYNWVGNVRELKNIIERGVLVGKGPELLPHDLGIEGTFKPEDVEHSNFKCLALTSEGLDFPELQQSIEQYYFEAALKLTGGNESKAAKLLNINLHTFRYRRKKAGPA
jgi:two-component system response regulator AtoC